MERAMLEQYIKRQVRKGQKNGNSEVIAPVKEKVDFNSLSNSEKRKFVKVEEQGSTLKIAVRFFQLKKPITKQHSYIVGVEMGGLAEEVTAITEISRTASFKQLRLQLEEKKDRGMVRRTITFQALRHFMEICENPHGYSDKRRRTEYRLGVLESEDTQVPTLLTPKQETKMPLTSIPIFDSYRTIVLIPVSQICPVTDRITSEVFKQPEDQLVLEDRPKEDNDNDVGRGETPTTEVFGSATWHDKPRQ